MVIERETLSDGSVCVLTPFDHRGCTVAREVDGVTVWGQAFGGWPEGNGEDPARRCREQMRADPGAFDRRALWDASGKAV